MTRLAARFALALAAVTLSACAQPTAPTASFGLAPVTDARGVQAIPVLPPTPARAAIAEILVTIDRLEADRVLNKNQAASLRDGVAQADYAANAGYYEEAIPDLQAVAALLDRMKKTDKKTPDGTVSLRQQVADAIQLLEDGQ
jgi:hypothetical protein